MSRRAPANRYEQKKKKTRELVSTNGYEEKRGNYKALIMLALGDNGLGGIKGQTGARGKTTKAAT
jgi:hypothetical protein